MRKFEIVETTIIMDINFCLLVSNRNPLGMSFSLVLEMKDSAWFPLTLNDFSLFDVVIAKFFSLSEGVERVGIYLIFFLS